MFRSQQSSSRMLKFAVATLALGGACVASHAAAISAGGTLSPIPGGTLPSGATFQTSRTLNFSYIGTSFINTPNGPIPIPVPMSGTASQSVYRLSDNTITFAYSIDNSATSDGNVSSFSVRDFSDYTVDVTSFNGIDLITNETMSSAERDLTGSAITFVRTGGIDPGNGSRTVYVKTNATAYVMPSRFYPVSSRLTITGGGGSTSIGGFAYPVEDSTPPTANIATPMGMSFGCNPLVITGTAFDTNGFDSYELEYQLATGGPWANIGTFTNPVSSTGTLASWNTSAVAQGWYVVRLTAYNTTGMTSTDSVVVFVDKQFDTVDLRSPTSGQALGGTICFDGTVSDGVGASFTNYTISYAPLPAASPFLPVNVGTPTYTTAVVNDGLGSWNAGAVPDGSYRIRITGTDACGYTRTVNRDIVVDNTRPNITLNLPAGCTWVPRNSVVQITGSVSDARLSGWALQYSGGSSGGWVTIATGTSNISGVLANWNTAGLPACAYTLRLVASDLTAVNCGSTTNQSEQHVSLNIGCKADFDASGTLSPQDIFDFLNAWFNGCP